MPDKYARIGTLPRCIGELFLDTAVPDIDVFVTAAVSGTGSAAAPHQDRYGGWGSELEPDGVLYDVGCNADSDRRQ